MSAMKGFRPRCSGCVFQQGLVSLDSVFQVTSTWLVSYQVSCDWLPCNSYCAPAEIRWPATAHGKCWRSLRKAQKPLHPGGLASQPCCDQHLSGLLACPCSQHFLFSTSSSPPGEQCCAVRRFIIMSCCRCPLWQPSEKPGVERMVGYIRHCQAGGLPASGSCPQPLSRQHARVGPVGAWTPGSPVTRSTSLLNRH